MTEQREKSIQEYWDGKLVRWDDEIRAGHRRHSDVDALKRHVHMSSTYLKNRATRFGTLVHNLG